MTKPGKSSDGSAEEPREPESHGWVERVEKRMRGLVPRYRRLRVTGVGRRGEALDFVASDFHARVIQHETDHLNGEVYLDRMPNMRSLAFLAEWQRFALPPSPGS